jgi:hypothetical protein
VCINVFRYAIFAQGVRSKRPARPRGGGIPGMRFLHYTCTPHRGYCVGVETDDPYLGEGEVMDPIGPGEPAWEAADNAIEAGKRGDNPQPYINEMTRELLAHGATIGIIREWEEFVWERIAAGDEE